MRKGFTLIELLIVITIIAILVGAAVPFVQDYIEDARITRAKADLNEIKSALIRYELDKGRVASFTTITELVGPYLSKALIDPWGTPYNISPKSSVVWSAGPDRTSNYNEATGGTTAGTADDLAVDFRPPLAMTKAYWIDTDKSGSVTNGDQVKLRFTRPILAAGLPNQDDIEVKVGAATYTTFTAAAGTIDASDNRGALISLTTLGAGGVFLPGRDTLRAATSSVRLRDESLLPYCPSAGGWYCKQNEVTIQSL